MKLRFTKILMRSLKALILVILASVFAFEGVAQSISIDSTTAAPNYPYESFGVRYDSDANDFLPGTEFYSVIDLNDNGYLDQGDHLLGQSDLDSGVIEGVLPRIIGNKSLYMIAANGQSLPAVGEYGSTYLSKSVFIFSYSGTSDVGDVAHSFDLDDTRRATSADFDFSDADFVTIRLTLNVSQVSETNPIIVTYSIDEGSNFTELTSIGDLEMLADTSGVFFYRVPEAGLTAATRFRISQNNSAGLNLDEESWIFSDARLIISDTEYLQFFSQTNGSVNILTPSFSFLNEVTTDTVGGSFSVDYEALGFTTGATFYYYTGTILDPNDRIIYTQGNATQGTFSGSFPLRDEATIDSDLRVAGIYGNIDEPTLAFDESTVTVNGSNSNGFTYAFNQNGIRSIRTNAVDLTGEDYLTLRLDFGASSNLSSDDQLRLQYSTNGSSWVTYDSLDGTDANNTNLAYDISGSAASASTQFRIIQKSFDNGSGNTWSIDGIVIDRYIEEYDQAFASYSLSNYDLSIVNIFDANGDNIADNSELYPGDSIAVVIDVFGFAADEEDYTVIIGGEYFLDIEDTTFNAVENQITISGNIPTDIGYGSSYTLEVSVYNGESPLIGISEDVFDDYEEDAIVLSSGIFDNGGAKFDEAGERSLTTPSFNIASANGLELSFYIARQNGVRSPSGTGIIIEFSTDGSSFTELDEININDAGTSGATYTLSDFDEAVASTTTSFRFRQSSNNGAGLDAWLVNNIQLVGSSNLFTPDYLDYSGAISIDIISPVISLDNIDDGGVDLYPGAEFTVEFEVTDGAFPDGTEFTLFIDREGFPIVLGTQIDPGIGMKGTFTANIPSVVAGTYDLYVISDYQNIESNSSLLPVIGIQINDVEVSSDDALVDGSSSIIYPGSTIDVTYNVVGDLGDGVTATLWVYDNDNEEYVSLTTLEEVDGTISAVLPLGINYDGDPDFKLTLLNGNLESLTILEDETFDLEEELSVGLFPLANREGYNSSNLWYGVAGERSGASVAFDLLGATKASVFFDLRIYDGFYSFDQDIHLQYSIDAGESWVGLEMAEMNEADVNVFPDYIELPEEALTEETYFRFITNEASEASGTQNIVYLKAFSLKAITLDPIASTDFTLSDSGIDLENLSVSVSNLGSPEYRLGEEFVVEYNADGPFPSEVSFAVVLEQDGDYLVLGESVATGSEQVNVNFPSYVFGDLDNNYNLSVEPFIKINDNDEYRAATLQTEVSEEEDFLIIEGRKDGEDGFDSFEFSKAGDRSLLTAALDLTTTDTINLKFSFTYTGGIPSTLLALPMLQVSIDGGASFDTLSVEGSGYEDEKYLYNTGNFEIGIPDEYLTEATHFRWIQTLNRGQNQNSWTISGIEILEGESNAFSSINWLRGPNNNPSQLISVKAPDLDDFVFEQSDPNDAVFNGEAFDYLWTIDSTLLDETTFPEGTQFVFTLSGVTDPETNEDVIIAETDGYGVDEANIPFYVENDAYSIRIYAYLLITDPDTGAEEAFFFFEDEEVGTLDIFNRAVNTTYTGASDLATLYAGSDVTFSIDIENDETSSTLDGLFSNLIVDFDGDEWLLVAQDGIADITLSLPPFISNTENGGDVAFRVELSENGPIGTVGVRLEALDNLTNLENDQDNFLSGIVKLDEREEEEEESSEESSGESEGVVEGSSSVVVMALAESGDYYVEFATTSGRRVITTSDVAGEDLSDTEIFEYYFEFDQLSEDLTVDQHIVFEYSTDQGGTYSQLDTFPAPGSNETFAEYVTHEISDDMKASGVRFRWRQNEAKGYAYIDDIVFTYAETLPFDYIPAQLTINTQSISVSSITQNDICSSDTVTVNYDINGRLGSEVVLSVYYEDEETESEGWLENSFAASSNGSGSVSFVLPSDAFDSDYDNGRFKFYVSIEDMSFETAKSWNDTYSVTSPFSDERIEVAQVISEEGFTYSNDITSCDPGSVIVSIASPQMYFMYEVSEVTTGNVLGTLAYDGESNEIEIGTFSETTEIQVTVISKTSSGKICNTKIVDDAEVKYIENYELSFTSDELDPVMTGVDSVVVCEGSYPNLSLALVNLNGDVIAADSSDVEWFIDDLNNPIDNADFGGTLGNTITEDEESDDTESLEAGLYFARITSGNCSYLTQGFKVVNIDIPEKPEIIVTGDITFCDGDGEAQLSATAGYAYYRWLYSSDGASFSYSENYTATITADEGGEYKVEVSNTPFSTGCSIESDVVKIESGSNPDFIPYSSLLDLEIDGTREITACDQTTVSLYREDYSEVVSAGDFDGIYTLYKDGSAIATTDSWNFIIDETGVYYIEFANDDVAATCTSRTVDFTVTITNTISTKPVITAGGALSFCPGGSVVLRATGGFAHYKWYNGTTLLGVSGDSISVNQSGNYSVEVSNVPFSSTVSCGSVRSKAVRVITSSEMSLSLNDGSTTFGNMDEVSMCGDDSPILNINGALGNYSVAWYFDGTAISGISSTATQISLSASGTYYAEVSRILGGSLIGDVTCVQSTYPVIVDYNEKLDPVSIEIPSVTTFCDGEVDLTLTADAGASHYIWYRNGSSIFSGTSNTFQVNSAGSYWVTVASDADACESEESNSVLVTSGQDMNLALNAGSGSFGKMAEVSLCSDSSPVLNLTGVLGVLSNYSVTWYLDGAAISGISPTATQISLSASGTYFAEVSQILESSSSGDVTCVQSTYPVIVDYSNKLNPVNIEVPTETNYCDGEVNLTLTADAGAPYYFWYKNGGQPIFSGTSNTIQVNSDGEYWVTIADSESACQSEESNVIRINTQVKANPYVGVATAGADCANGDVRVQIGGLFISGLGSANTSTNQIYQLIDQATGQELGAPVIGSGGAVFTSVPDLTEETFLLVEASYADGSGCSDVSIGAMGSAIPNSVILEVKGTVVTATVYTTGGYDISWLRNGVIMRNATGSTINVTDAATYTVEVTFDNGCLISSNSVDIGARRTQPITTASNGRMVANTYPNPTSSSINLDVPGDRMGNYSVQIMTLSGQVVLSGTFTKTEVDHIEKIDISDLDRGIYNIIISKGKQVENIRIIKQ